MRRVNLLENFLTAPLVIGALATLQNFTSSTQVRGTLQAVRDLHALFDGTVRQGDLDRFIGKLCPAWYADINTDLGRVNTHLGRKLDTHASMFTSQHHYAL